MKILVTGGCGFIGSHTTVELLERNYEVVIIDNFSNSKPDALDKIKQITNKEVAFYEGDVCDKNIFIEMNKELESLNVAIAGAIIMHYFY